MIVSGGDSIGKPTYEMASIAANIQVALEHQPSTPATTGNSKKGTSPRPPRSTVISLQQQQLLKSHLDIIQDVVVLRQPYGMIVSVDRAGMVYVFR